MQNLYYHLPDLPAVPEQFVADLLCRARNEHRHDITQNRLRPDYQSRMITNSAHRGPIPSTRSQRDQTSSDFQSWIRENIVPDFTECSISVTETSLGSIHGAHTDWTRHWILIWPLIVGGPHCRTTWYQEKGQPVRRPDLGCYVTDYDQIQVLDSVIMRERSWYLVDTRVLHGVENIDVDRVTVQIGLWHINHVMSKILPKENIQ